MTLGSHEKDLHHHNHGNIGREAARTFALEAALTVYVCLAYPAMQAAGD
jgi:hypothetical protein